MWTKIIRIDPFGRINDESIHVVKYYKTKNDKEYYLFKYVPANNNGSRVNNLKNIIGIK